MQKYGKIDVIVSNAGVNPAPGPVLDTPESALDKLWDVNVKASILLLREAVPHLAKDSAVILVSTAAAYQYVPIIGMYGVSKTALLALTKALAAEMSPNARVNCIAPGYVPTEFSSIGLGRYGYVTDAFLQATCLKRAGTTEEIAAAAVFLASDDASYITGETLVVAGGPHARL
ncbi:hypothetical protein Cgig2_020430 [Carnegiea gigantea]|uniref:Tropinone reductase-like 3 n=1 Tax=Carnegiea gigantea TaxID=171969 RepID=A0A9Q1Q9Z9_9CARY|nr:hypothetical protein Cgig2_020430 [Carnegiea gigantea]